MAGKLSEKRNPRNKIIIIILAVIILIMIISLIINLYDMGLEKKEIYAKVIVAENVGFDVNATALMFGKVMPGGSAVRDIKVENNYNEDVRVKIYTKGDIKEFISVSDNNFLLEKDKARDVSFIVSIPEKTEYGEYEGKVIINIRKA